MKKFLVSILLATFTTLMINAQQTKPAPAAPALDETIAMALKGFSGKVWIYAKNLDTGKDYSLRGDEPVRTASTIKLPVLAEAYHQVAAGKLKWDDELVLTTEKKKGGSGILFEFSNNTRLDLRSAAHLMIVLSDNTATNLVLEKVTCDSVNDFMVTLGLKQTLCLRHVFGGGESKAYADPANKAFGLGKSSPRDMVRLLEMLEKGEVVSKEASAEMIGILRRQQYKNGIGRGLPDSIDSASKSGTLDALRADVGILYTPRGRIAIAITVDEMPVVAYNEENPGLAMIWKLSQILQDGLGAGNPDSGYKPAAGFVPDEKTAIAIAVAAWLPVYGKNMIDGEKPYKAVLKDGVWTVTGTLKTEAGGTAQAEISRDTGCILRITHGK